MLKKPKAILVCKDKDGVNTVFEAKNFERHKHKHPELGDKAFMPPLVELTVRDPERIYRSYNDQNSLCLYREHAANGTTAYAKIVIQIGEVDIETGEPVNYIKTAFIIDRIKESKYGRPIYYKK